MNNINPNQNKRNNNVQGDRSRTGLTVTLIFLILANLIVLTILIVALVKKKKDNSLYS